MTTNVSPFLCLDALQITFKVFYRSTCLLKGRLTLGSRSRQELAIPILFLAIPPWGTPIIELLSLLYSTYPARTIFQYRSINLWSLKWLHNRSSSTWWSMLSKKALKSPSIYHFTPFQYLIFASAERQPLEGLNPCEWGENLGSRTCSKIALNASWIILSRGDAIPRGLILPFFFWNIYSPSGPKLKLFTC